MQTQPGQPPQLVLPDTQDTQNSADNNDPMRLLKLSHSLRYQLSHPVKRGPAPPPLTAAQPPAGTPQFAQQAPPLYPPGATASPHSPQGWSAAPLGPPTVPAAAGAGMQPAETSPPGPWPQGSLPPLKGPGTKSGPYTGFASRSWLEAEVRGDVEALRQHVDAFVTQRERRAFDLERSAMRAEIEHLRKRLGEAEDKVVRLELMLPDSNGEFRALRAELEELEKEADQFSGMHERQAKATQTAVTAIKQALADMDEIEEEFDRIQRIINTLPGPAAGGGPQYGGGGGTVGTGGAGGAGRPGSAVGVGVGGGGSPPVVAPRRCCGCLPFRRKK